MPGGTCDPASRGATFNAGELVEGPVQITYRYGWDGTSLRSDATGCVGPLTRVTAVNTSATVTMYAHFKGRRGTPRTIVMAPGFNQVYTQPQLGNQGFTDNTDLENLIISNSPADPAQVSK